MVVVAIMAIVMTISVPFLHNAIDRRKGMNGAVKDVQEACKMARDWAILQQTTQELRIRPGDGTFEVSGVSAGVSTRERLESKDVAGNEWRMPDKPAGSTSGKAGGSFSVKLPEGVVIEALLTDGEDATEAEVGRVHFRSNGTCDEMNVVLYCPEKNERRQIWLEVVTGLADIETDPAKFKMH